MAESSYLSLRAPLLESRSPESGTPVDAPCQQRKRSFRLSGASLALLSLLSICGLLLSLLSLHQRSLFDEKLKIQPERDLVLLSPLSRGDHDVGDVTRVRLALQGRREEERKEREQDDVTLLGKKNRRRPHPTTPPPLSSDSLQDVLNGSTPSVSASPESPMGSEEPMVFPRRPPSLCELGERSTEGERGEKRKRRERPAFVPHVLGDNLLVLEVKLSALRKPFIIKSEELRAPGLERIALELNQTLSDSLVFSLTLSPSKKHLDLMQVPYDVRANEDQDLETVRANSRSGWKTSLPIVAIYPGSMGKERVQERGDSSLEDLFGPLGDGQGREPVRGKEEEDEPSVYVSALPLISEGFYQYDFVVLADAFRVLFSQEFPCHAFPRNADISIEYHVLSPSSLSSSGLQTLAKIHGLSAIVRFSLALLPDVPMTGRVETEEVGFFTTSYSSIGIDRGERSHPFQRFDRKVSLINRRRLEKKVKRESGREREDEQESVDPIVYYVDTSIPKRWRNAVCEGILRWNSALEPLGFPNALRCLQPDSPEFPDDFHPMDARYSTISWTFGPGFAIGTSYVDPRSGEILSSHIWISDAFVRGWAKSVEAFGLLEETAGKPSVSAAEWATTLLEEVDSAEKKERASLRGGHADHGDCRHQELLSYSSEASSFALLQRILSSLEEGEETIDGAEGRGEETQDDVSLPSPLSLLERVIERGIASVACHEAGHTLGLRHNFRGSTQATWEQLDDWEYLEKHGISSSVMDYLPLNVRPKGNKSETEPASERKDPLKFLFQDTIGDYDKLAIFYGYAPLEREKERTGQKSKELMERMREREQFPYQSDEEAELGENPYVNIFDLSSSPLRFIENQLQLYREVRERERENMKDGDSFKLLWETEKKVLLNIADLAAMAAKYIGGADVSRLPKGSLKGEAPVSLIAREEQERALEVILSLLTERERVFPEREYWSLYVKDASDCDDEEGGSSPLTDDCSSTASVNVESAISVIKRKILSSLFSLSRLQRLENQGESAPLSLEEIFDRVLKAIWEGKTLAVSSPTHWAVQDHYLGLMSSLSHQRDKLLLSSALATESLERVRELSSFAMRNATSAAVRGHLRQVVANITRGGRRGNIGSDGEKSFA